MNFIYACKEGSREDGIGKGQKMFEKNNENIEGNKIEYVREKVGYREYKGIENKEIEDMCISTTKKDLEFAYTNKEYGHYTGETGKENRRKWQGLIIRCYSYVNNFIFKLGGMDESGNLRDDTHVETRVYPDRLVRMYRVHNGATEIREEIFMPDGLDVLLIRYTTTWTGSAYFYPHFDIRPHYWDKPSRQYSYQWNSSSKSIVISHADSPGFVALKSSLDATFEETNYALWDGYIPKNYPKDAERGDSGLGEAFQPGALVVNLGNGVSATFAFSVASNEKDAISNASYAVEHYDDLLAKKRERIMKVLEIVSEEKGNFSTSDEQFNKAFKWAIVSMDSLILNAFGKGIAAGLHWFADYWGRDMFISFPGAVLVTGKYDDAKEILRTACRIQDKNASSQTFGRIPNRITLGETIYNTADATPWFIREFYEYVRYTGDVEFAKENFDTIKNAIWGEKKRMDGYNFSVHGDQETWMDGIRDGAVCSPRGNRAVEIQALWYNALVYAAKIANLTGNLTESEEWMRIAERLKENFNMQFWNANDNSLYDHINSNGTKDSEKRPNEIFAASLPFADEFEKRLLSDERELSVVKDVIKYCVVRWGVRSLSNQTKGFFNEYLDKNMCNAYACNGYVYYHPYHDYGTHTGLDHHDWSYHNGDVWHWLSGPVISSMVRHGLVDDAYILTDTLTHHLLEGLTLGSLCEIMDGDSSGNIYGWDKGAISQAWSLAEYIRVFYQSYLGITPDLSNRTLVFEPALPVRLGEVIATQRLGDGVLKVKVSKERNNMSLSTNGLKYELNVTIGVRVPDILENVSSDKLRVKVNGEDVTFEVKNRTFGRLVEVKCVLSDTKPIELEIYSIGEDASGVRDHPPVLKDNVGSTYTIRGGFKNYLDLKDKFYDADGDSMNFSVIYTTNLSFNLHDGIIEYWTDANGTFLCEILINCSSNMSYMHWLVTVYSYANRAPKISYVVPVDGDRYEDGDNVMFMCSVSDPDGDSFFVSWYMYENGSRQLFGNGSSFTKRVSAGKYWLGILAEDALGAFSYANTTFEVNGKNGKNVLHDSYSQFGLGILSLVVSVVLLAVGLCYFVFKKRAWMKKRE
ncbi:MAG: amylo-alpha-1,6-glucosidase [Thermoplasmata archaeon]